MLKVIILTTASKYIQLVLMYVNDILVDTGLVVVVFKLIMTGMSIAYP